MATFFRGFRAITGALLAVAMIPLHLLIDWVAALGLAMVWVLRA